MNVKQLCWCDLFIFLALDTDPSYYERAFVDTDIGALLQ